MLRPKNMRRGSGILVYDVPNRGSKRIFTLLDDVAPTDPARNNDPKTKEDAGLGFLLGRGYALVWSGWDPGAPRANGGLGADFPAAMQNGRPDRRPHPRRVPHRHARPGRRQHATASPTP